MSTHLYSQRKHSPYLQAVDRQPRGLGRSDLSPFFASPTAFPSFISDIVDHFASKDFDSIVALDAVGFVVAGALAAKVGKPVVLCRKEGKLPLHEEEIARTEELVDYSKKTKRFEIRKDLLTPGKSLIKLIVSASRGFPGELEEGQQEQMEERREGEMSSRAQHVRPPS